MITRDDLDAFGYYDVEEAPKAHKTPLQMVREFSEVMGLPLDAPWMDEDGHDSKLEMLRFDLVHEEFREFEEAHEKENLLKELADLVYVTYGYAATYGLDLDEAVRRVHNSNMSKLDDSGKPIKRSDGKVIKSNNYVEPDLSDLV